LKARSIAYWITTIVLAFCIRSGGAAETVHYQANVEGIIVRLGYPLYFLTIIGIWKVLGAIAILIPRFPKSTRYYIAERNPAAAAAIARQIEQVVSWIAEFPHMGYRVDDSGLRMLPVGRYPYLIFYTAEEDEVVIRNVRHAARRRPWQERL
jgi:plasmid stabilization system protein ParE